MTDTPSLVVALLADCDAHGIELIAVGDELSIDAPQDALTPEFLVLLKAHKAELLALLRTMPEPAADSITDAHRPVKNVKLRTPTTKPVCRCGSTTWRDVPIHDGQSIRRDCGHCGRFLDFPVWYGKNAGPNGQ